MLREKWPLAFPLKHQDVRPLARGAASEIAAVMGWSLPYTLGVLGRWKMAAVYCQAVLNARRPKAVDAEAKHLAAKQLVQFATRKIEKKAAEAAEGCPGPANRDAGAITPPGACSTVAPARIAARKKA